MTAYEEHVLHAPDVCNNCFQRIREERVDPARTGWREYESHYARREETTEIGYGPADSVSEQKGVWCGCGVESARDRIWAYTEPDREQFKTLLQNAVQTLDHKGVTIDRKKMIAHALQAFDDGANVDAAIERGLDVGLAVAASSNRATAD